MASLEKYRACIQHLLTERAQQGGDQWVEAQTIFDTEHDHDQLLYNGWMTRSVFLGQSYTWISKMARSGFSGMALKTTSRRNSWHSESPNTILCSGFAHQKCGSIRNTP